MRDPAVQRAAAARKRTAAKRAFDTYALNPLNSSAAMDLAETYSQYQMWTPARDLAIAAIKGSPDDWELRVRYSRILTEMANGEAAVLHARRACELATPRETGVLTSGWVAGTAGRALLLYARQLKVAGRHDDAEAHLQEALARLLASGPMINPGESDEWGRGYALGALAMVLEELGQAEEANDALRALLELDGLTDGAEEVAAFLGADWAWDSLQRRWDELDGSSIEYVVNSPFASSLHSLAIWPHFAKSLGLHPDQAREVLAGLSWRRRSDDADSLG
jgi:tetratricopeptide (TPR) repeat protein